MASVTIFGDGNMGSAIADVLTKGGATVDHITTAEEGRGRSRVTLSSWPCLTRPWTDRHLLR